MNEPLLTLSNPMRYLVPIGTAVGAIVMFMVPVAVAGIADTKVAIGSAALLVIVAWLFRSAWRAPHALRLDDGTLAIARLSGERAYGFADVRKWWFAVPNGPPTQSPPATNGVLYVVLADSTRFRGEVTSDEAVQVARVLVGTTLASPAAA
jgi:hypothetical protein